MYLKFIPKVYSIAEIIFLQILKKLGKTRSFFSRAAEWADFAPGGILKPACSTYAIRLRILALKLTNLDWREIFRLRNDVENRQLTKLS